MGRLILAIVLLAGVVGLGVLTTSLRSRFFGDRIPEPKKPKPVNSYKKFSPVPTQVSRQLVSEYLENPASKSSKNASVADKTPWAIWVFTAKGCQTCPGVLGLAKRLESTEVSIIEFEAEKDAKIHLHYKIDSVPLTLLVNQTGGVELSFYGPLDLNKVKNHIGI